MTASRRRTWLVVGGVSTVLVAAGIGLMAWATGLGQRPTTWEDLGPVQVLALPEGLCAFVQVDRMVHLPGAQVSAPVRAIGHRQVVVVLRPDGTQEVTPIRRRNGVSFHPNTSRIVGDRDGGIYLVQGASLGHRRSVFVLDGDHFTLLDREPSDAWLKAHGVADVSPAELKPALDRISAEAGARLLMTESALPGPEADAAPGVEWREVYYMFSQRTAGQGVEVRLTGGGGASPVLVTYDPRVVPLEPSLEESVRGVPEQRGHSR